MSVLAERLVLWFQVNLDPPLNDRGVLKVEDWAEICRLHRAGAGGPSAGAGDGVGAFADDRGGDDPVPGGAGSAGWVLASDQWSGASRLRRGREIDAA